MNKHLIILIAAILCLVATTYIPVTVKDANNCIVTKNGLKVKQPASGCTTFADAAKSEFPRNFTFSVFPNPTNNSFALNFLNCNNQKVIIKVRDIYGREIFSTSCFCSQKFYFGENFSAGVYFVQVIDDKKVETIKLVKQ